MSSGFNIRFYTYYDQCNYACPYCIAGHGHVGVADMWDINKFKEIMNAIPRKWDNIDLRIDTNGEPFLNDDILNEVITVSTHNTINTITLVTNLSLPAKKYVNFIKQCNDKLMLIGTYHPTEVKEPSRAWGRSTDNQSFINKAIEINQLCNLTIVSVCYPENFEQLFNFKDACKRNKLTFFPKGFIGNDYPAKYTDADKVSMLKLGMTKHDYQYQIERKTPGLCNAGYRHFYITINGWIKPCGRSNHHLGHISEEKLTSNNQPCPCSYGSCFATAGNINTVEYQSKVLKEI